jgi:hypothetical protein
MERRRDKLWQKLWELNLPQELNKKNYQLLFSTRRDLQRRHSANPIDRVVPRMEGRLVNELEIEVDPFYQEGSKKYVLQSVEADPNGYATFLKLLQRTYDVMCNSTGSLEKLCAKILKLYKPECSIGGRNIHKTLFLFKILEDRLIEVSV